MSKHIYPWYTWGPRAIRGIVFLAASFLRDWFPRHERKEDHGEDNQQHD
jgi:hypothetical protein